MNVRFINTWRVPGFGRKRFLKGIVRDVPDQLKPILPSSAKILPDNTPSDEELLRVQDELIAADLARASAESASAAALKAAGLEGLVDQTAEEPVKEPYVEPVDPKPTRTKK